MDNDLSKANQVNATQFFISVQLLSKVGTNSEELFFFGRDVAEGLGRKQVFLRARIKEHFFKNYEKGQIQIDQITVTCR